MKKYSNKLNRFFPIIFILVVIIFILLRGGASMDLDFEDDVLNISIPEEFSFTLSYDEIASMDLVEFTDPGTMLSGGEDSNYSWGAWENEAWGQYDRCTSQKAAAAILITTLDDAHLVLSYQDDDATASLFQAFNELLADRTAEAT